MKLYEKMIKDHWSYVKNILYTYDISFRTIEEDKLYYLEGMLQGYLDAKNYENPRDCFEERSLFEPNVRHLFHFNTAYAHGFKHGKEDIKIGVYLQ